MVATKVAMATAATNRYCFVFMVIAYNFRLLTEVVQQTPFILKSTMQIAPPAARFDVKDFDLIHFHDFSQVMSVSLESLEGFNKRLN